MFGYRYPTRSHDALGGVSLDLVPGVVTLVSGPSGAGKSTLLRATNGLVPHFTGGTVRGQVVVAGVDPIALGPGAMSSIVGFVAGDPERSFVMDTVADEVAFALESRGLARSEMHRRVAHALDQVGLTGFDERDLATLSGGERQRVAVAAALALAPRVLVLDEPTSQLDDRAAEAVLQAARHLAEERGLTVILSEHRIDRVVPHARHMVYLPAPGVPPASGTVDAVAPRPVTPPGPPPPPPAGPPLLTVTDVRFAYDDRAILTGASLTVHAGEVVALMGPSGCGKTTLLRLVVGLLRPAGGEIRAAGTSIAGRTVAEICGRVGYLPQDPSALLFAASVRTELAVTLANHGLAGDQAARIEALLAALGIADLADRYPRDLSTGQRQRVALAAVAVARPDVLVVGEPTRGLDDVALAALGETLHALARAGTAVLVATHDRRLARAAHRVLTMDDGRVVEVGPPFAPGRTGEAHGVHDVVVSGAPGL